MPHTIKNIQKHTLVIDGELFSTQTDRNLIKEMNKEELYVFTKTTQFILNN
ncbi:MAG: hypothetical protein OEL89_03045 [Candidatus Peregrinibacteria bacterium]|nr:hypothetical protein [Candidatus Peregrinibacteria bacterium]